MYSHTYTYISLSLYIYIYIYIYVYIYIDKPIRAGQDACGLESVGTACC